MARVDKSQTRAKRGVASDAEARRGSVDEESRSAARTDRRRARERPPATADAPTPRAPSPTVKATPRAATSTRPPVRTGESRREDRSTAEAKHDDRATKSAVVRGAATRVARVPRGGDKREGTLDRSAGGARRSPTLRVTGAKKGRGANKGGTGGRGATS